MAGRQSTTGHVPLGPTASNARDVGRRDLSRGAAVEDGEA